MQGRDRTYGLGNLSLNSCNISRVGRVALKGDFAVGQSTKIDRLCVKELVSADNLISGR